ncbi:hypothetical protein EN833_34530, partial [Mesorhizobium sp. M4B.F.Ca.ET.190.01.1.1]
MAMPPGAVCWTMAPLPMPMPLSPLTVVRGPIAIGQTATVNQAGSIALSATSTANGAQSMALGAGATANEPGSVALGAGSKTAAAVATTGTTINGVAYTFAG